MKTNSSFNKPESDNFLIEGADGQYVLTVPYIAFDSPYEAALTAYSQIEKVTGVMAKAWIRPNGSIQNGMLLTDANTEHAQILLRIRQEETQGTLPAGTSLMVINEILNGTFDGMVHGERVLPEKLAIKSILASLEQKEQ